MGEKINGGFGQKTAANFGEKSTGKMGKIPFSRRRAVV